MQPKNWAHERRRRAPALVRDGDGAGAWRRSAARSCSARRPRARSPAVLAATEPAHRRDRRLGDRADRHARRSPGAPTRRACVDTPLIDFMLEVQRRAAGADLASDRRVLARRVARRRDRSRWRELRALYPYDNTLRAVRITGAQLREYLEYSARYYRTRRRTAASTRRSDGARLQLRHRRGRRLRARRLAPVGPARHAARGARAAGRADATRFTLALNNYRQTGGGGFAMLARRAGRVRQAAGDPPAADRRGDARAARSRPQDYFTRNWRLEPAGAVGAAVCADAPATRRCDAPRSGARRRGRARAARPPRPAHARCASSRTNDFHGALEPRAGQPRRASRRRGVPRRRRSRARAPSASPPACVTLLARRRRRVPGHARVEPRLRPPGRASCSTSSATSAAALGNHEFDWGQDTLRARMREARYPILGANVRYADGRDVPWIRDDTLIVRRRAQGRRHRRGDGAHAAHDRGGERRGSALPRPGADRRQPARAACARAAPTT